jgi:hypothetical protein
MCRYRKLSSSVNMVMNKALVGVCLALLLGLAGCSRQQSDWEKTRAANTTDSYEQFLKKYPSGEFTAQAQARVKELYEERDWQKARDTDTQEAYQAFLEAVSGREMDRRSTHSRGEFHAGPGAAERHAGRHGERQRLEIQQAVRWRIRPRRHSRPRPRRPRPMAAAKPAKPAAVAAKTPAGEGAYGIQLGAFKSSADAANKRWAHLEKEYPKALAGLVADGVAEEERLGNSVPLAG